VSIAVATGIAEPHLITTPTESALVPNSLLQPYTDMLGKQQTSGRFTEPALRPMPATNVTAQLIRVYDGKIQGLHMLPNLGPTGFHSPWVGH